MSLIDLQEFALAASTTLSRRNAGEPLEVAAGVLLHRPDARAYAVRTVARTRSTLPEREHPAGRYLIALARRADKSTAGA